MFQTVKQSVKLLDVISKDLGLELIPCGSENFKIEDERDHGGCSFCGHMDCFRVHCIDGDETNARYKCFSCGESGDVITWRAKRNSVSPKEAALELAKEYGIQLPNDWSPIQEIFQLAACYYETCLWNSCDRPYPELDKLTPKQYQTERRRHSEAALRHFQVGWSDGGLITYLESLGFDEEILRESGLASVDKKSGRIRGDFLPAKCFIYPHYAKGRVSHFTFKDATNRLAYQLPKKFSLNGYVFYNQDSISEADTVLIVEGENDLISVWDTGLAPAVIATIGQISGEQLDWIRAHLVGKTLITLFDPDDAGDKYRAKVEKLRSFISRMAHVRPPGDMDIDEHLAAGADLEKLILANAIKVGISPGRPPVAIASRDETEPEQSEEATAFQEKLAAAGIVSAPGLVSELIFGSTPATPMHEIGRNPIVQKDGCYWRTEFKDGEPKLIQISNFIIEPRNIFVNEDDERLRDVLIVRKDGRKSGPVHIDSKTKVDLRSFKIMLANACDASFRGRDSDMAPMWDLVYPAGSETIVQMPRHVGRNEGLAGWLFGNKFIGDTGIAIAPDEQGIFWLPDRPLGIRPESLSVANRNTMRNNDIPQLDTSLTADEKDELLSEVVHALAKNRDNPGQALTMLGWIHSNVYSNTIYDMNRGFPFLFLFGVNGKGKSTIARWLQEFYGMGTIGYTSVPQLGTGVGSGRKAEYYSSLPIFIDEVRSNRETEEFLGLFRSYYDRTAKDLGTKERYGISTRPVRSTFIFAGEDQFNDPAARERCIPVRISAKPGEAESYRWLEDNKHRFTGITYHWILESTSMDHGNLKEEIRALDSELTSHGCSQRTSKNWAVVGVFGMRLAARYMPDFDYKAFLLTAVKQESTNQRANTTLMNFFEAVEGIQAEDRSRINGNHIAVEGNNIYMWFAEIFRIVQNAERNRSPFSKTAVLSALREEPYFLREGQQIQMGMSGVRRDVLTLNLAGAPDCIKNLALHESSATISTQPQTPSYSTLQ